MDGLENSLSKICLQQNNGKKYKRSFHEFHNFYPTSNQPLDAKIGTAKPNSGPGADVPFFKGGSGFYSVSKQRIEDQQQMLTRTFAPDIESSIPLATTQYYSANRSICDPRHMILSVYNIPNSEYLRASTKLPLGLNVQPFAKAVGIDKDIELVSTIQQGEPLRCKRCRAFVNPKFVFSYYNKVVCNICRIETQISPEMCGLHGYNSINSYLSQNPALFKGTVDFLVPGLYNIKPHHPTVPLHYVFLVDISSWANENKSSLVFIEGIRRCVNYIAENQPNCKVAIIAFDRYLRFFNLRPDATHMQELDVCELKEVFLPLYHGLFVNPIESMHVIQDTLMKLETFIQYDKYSHKNEVSYGSGLEAALLALETCTNGNGGKIIVSLNTVPTFGNGNLVISKDNVPKKHLKCDNEFYQKLSQRMLKSCVSVDLFCTGSEYMDLATLSYPVLVTSGTLKHYPGFNMNKHKFIILNDILQSVSGTVGYQAQLKVRCSSGLSVATYYTTACNNSDRHPFIPVINRDHSFNILFKYYGNLRVGSDVCFQAALLYTDLDGVRKVRTINATASVKDNVAEIFNSANQDVVNSLIRMNVLSSFKDCDFAQISKSIDSKLTDILTQYRAIVDCSRGSQLVLPKILNSLPAYLLSFKRSEFLRDNKQSSRGNERFLDYFKHLTYNNHKLAYKLYPQIFPLHEVFSTDDYMFYEENNQLLQLDSMEVLSVPATHLALVDGGCYLIFQGDYAYLWFNQNTNRHLLRDLLDSNLNPEIQNYSDISILDAQLPVLDTEINIRARNIIQYWAQIVDILFIPVLTLRPKIDSYYSSVMKMLMCEDKSIDFTDSYDNYLISLNTKIKENLDQERYIKNFSSTLAKDDNISQRFIHF